jgi:two-component system response regulator GlrR
VENELFGHRAGAFTGAQSAASGLIQEAEGGTLFLDEINSLPLSTQVKLLRFLQDQQFRAVGSSKLEQASVRVVAASNGNLREAIRCHSFREDLFYRLQVTTLELPPLRERVDDIPILARHLLEKHAQSLSQPARVLSTGAVQKLQSHSWPGNVRELENVIKSAVVLTDSEIVRGEDIRLPNPDLPPGEENSFQELKARAVLSFERHYLVNCLRTHRGNVSEAARAAKKDRRAFFELLRKHRLHIQVRTESEEGGRINLSYP